MTEPRWLLVDEHRSEPGLALGACAEIDGLFVEPAPPPDPERYTLRPPAPVAPVTLVGVRPEPALLAALAPLPAGEPTRRAREQRQIRATLYALDAEGATARVVTTDVLTVAVTGSRPSSVGDGLLDITTDGGFTDPLPNGAREIWERWYDGRPTVPNLWAGYDRELRHQWAGAALGHHRHGRPDRRAGRTYHLDGRYVTDVEGFYCAVGEAVNGPGGYFGWNLDALVDCLRGRWGATTPFRLVWHDADVARQYLVPGYDRRRLAPAVTLDHLLDLLREHGVTTELR